MLFRKWLKKSFLSLTLVVAVLSGILGLGSTDSLATAAENQAERVAHWKLDEGSGTTAADSSGNGNTGTLVNNPAWAGKFGGALSFTGGSRVEINSSATLNKSGDETVSMWFKTSQSANGTVSIFRQDKRFTALQLTSGQARAAYWINGLSGYKALTFPWIYNDNNWHHYVASYDQTTGLKVYVDGNLVASSATNLGALPTVTNKIVLGASESGGEAYNGLLDEISVFSGALTQAQVMQLMNEFDRSNLPDGAVPVTGVQLDKPTLTLKAGDTAELAATVLPSYATNKNISLKSSDENVAKAELYGGKAIVTAKNAGSAKITVTTAEGGFAAECIVTVEADSIPKVRVLTYNIHHGAGTDGVLNLGRIADVIKSANPDIVALQEVDVNVPRSGTVDQAKKLGELTGMNVGFGKAINLSGGEYGTAILSRHPIISSEKYFLPGGGEQRVVLAAKIAPQNGLPIFTFLNTHLEYSSPSITEAQANKIVELYGATYPSILAGDFNAIPGTNAIRILTNKWTDATSGITDSTSEDGKKIDYVMYGENYQWRVASATAIHEDVASDHRPVLAVLEWPGDQGPAEVPQVVIAGPEKVSAGQTFNLTMGLTGVTQSVYQSVYAQDLTLHYDPVNLQLDSITSLKDGFQVIDRKETAPGQIRILAASVGANVPAQGDLLTFKFTAKSVTQATYSTTISVDNVVIANGQGNELQINGVSRELQIIKPVDKSLLNALIASAQAKHNTAVEGNEDGLYAIGAKAQLQSAIDTARATANDPNAAQQQVDSAKAALEAAIQVFDSNRISADINGGGVTIGDLAIVAGAYGTQEGQTGWNEKADVNKDGKVDITDLAIVAKAILL
ncbi:LamG-like jellyroll fold domain-containing protein [Paenibacillus aceris]|uniref:Endonuclease/exonuclease/phosphatase family metal-dependent hydrolase n=1 Tax=Paenibacillus aceris TaxID=869555 RepID=A0ABS4I1U1_9BACL|nr:LamG-like jellyroll fold domain-containing protein [Paenibacillus aceris]MBP1964876.1 endonuclease/exonuclease/phosphatase family metal-dependent hydrolase [Paenibacillus aceris]